MMTTRKRTGRTTRQGLLLPCGVLLGLAGLGGAVGAVAQSGPLVVSQKGRAFVPGDLSIHQNDTVRIINDDGDLLHHAYIDSPTFSFDSGDQEPGGKADIVFTTKGTFNVLCGIHPKMKLVVHVN